MDEGGEDDPNGTPSLLFLSMSMHILTKASGHACKKKKKVTHKEMTKEKRMMRYDYIARNLLLSALRSNLWA